MIYLFYFWRKPIDMTDKEEIKELLKEYLY